MCDIVHADSKLLTLMEEMHLRLPEKNVAIVEKDSNKGGAWKMFMLIMLTML